MLRAAVLVLAACGSGTPSTVTDGMHFALRARLDKLAAEHRSDIAAGLQAALVAPGIARSVQQREDRIEVVPGDDPAQVKALVTREYPELETCGDMCFRLRPAYVKEQGQKAIAQTVAIVRARLRQTIRQAVVTPTELGIAIDVASPSDVEMSAIEVFVMRSARIELRPVDHDAPFMRELAAVIVKDMPAGIAVESERWHVAGGDEEDVFVVGERKALEEYLSHSPPPPDREFGYEQRTRDWRTYYLMRGMRISSVKNATSEHGERPAVTVELDDASAAQLEKLSTASVGKKLAIVLDGVVVSAPIMSSKISGSFSITLDEQGDVDSLARLLRSGSLPVELYKETVAEIKNGKVVPPP